MQSNTIRQREKNHLRFLKLLSKYRARGLKYTGTDEKYIVHAKTRDHSFDRGEVNTWQQKNHVEIDGGCIRITELGLAALKIALQPDMQTVGPERMLQPVTVNLPSGKHDAVQNINESPLARLYTRKDKHGNAYISTAEFEAGERLRKDFERGNLQPKISANLCASVGGSARWAGNSSADISDFAIDARGRISKAVDVLGPELSGVTLDICCFLKGLELVERERKWPPRSAKLMLKTALSILARHYGIVGYANSKKQGIKTWNTDDYRPQIS